MKIISLDWKEIPAYLDLTCEPRGTAKLQLAPPASPPQKRAALVIWDDDNHPVDALPRLIILNDSEFDDFLAWSATFLNKLRPLTAFVRVLPWKQYILYGQPAYFELRPRIYHVLVAAIMGETMDGNPTRGFLENLPSAAFESTYSLAMASALFQGRGPDLMSMASAAWIDLRRLTEQSSRNVSPDQLACIWRILDRLWQDSLIPEIPSPDDELIYVACRELLTSGDIHKSTWKKLVGDVLPPISVSEFSESSKERRVEMFEEVANKLLAGRLSREVLGFLLGYVGSLIAPGATEHFAIIGSHIEVAPSSMIWYFVCSALHHKTTILSDYSHLGTKVLRLIKNPTPPQSLPTADISYNELRILSRGREGARNFRQASSSFLRVELLPGITTVVRWPSRTHSTQQMSLFTEPTSQPVENNASMTQILQSVHQALRLVENALGQTNLTSPPTKRGRKQK